jgi:hypothetical protein
MSVPVEVPFLFPASFKSSRDRRETDVWVADTVLALLPEANMGAAPLAYSVEDERARVEWRLLDGRLMRPVLDRAGVPASPDTLFGKMADPRALYLGRLMDRAWFDHPGSPFSSPAEERLFHVQSHRDGVLDLASMPPVRRGKDRWIREDRAGFEHRTLARVADMVAHGGLVWRPATPPALAIGVNPFGPVLETVVGDRLPHGYSPRVFMALHEKAAAEAMAARLAETRGGEVSDRRADCIDYGIHRPAPAPDRRFLEKLYTCLCEHLGTVLAMSADASELAAFSVIRQALRLADLQGDDSLLPAAFETVARSAGTAPEDSPLREAAALSALAETMRLEHPATTDDTALASVRF